MIIFSDSRDPIFKSRDSNRVPETPRIGSLKQHPNLKKTILGVC